MNIQKYTQEAVELLECLIAKPSISRDEALAADVMEQQMKAWGLNPRRFGNNIAAWDELDEQKPTLLLNAHIDTVKPVSSWTRDPFKPTLEGDRLYGLGANDCGGGLVSLLPQPSTLNPQPSTLNPQPSTLNPPPPTTSSSLPRPKKRSADRAASAWHCRNCQRLTSPSLANPPACNPP